MSEFVEKYINPEGEYYRDFKNSLDTDREEGEAEGEIKGIMKGKIEVARKMLAMEMPMETIIQLTGPSEEQIKSLK